MFFQLLILIILFYVINKIFKYVYGQTPPPRDQEVRGQAHSKPLDLSESDIEDVEYKDLPK